VRCKLISKAVLDVDVLDFETLAGTRVGPEQAAIFLLGDCTLIDIWRLTTAVSSTV
jgi:hypothetical protein